ncbi:hypothetical protein TcBrA4_0016300 [Trypanosoma cruzi]|nr:hypothetical protein TcBrA4_0016300 [Trypanosoma cruzi]
MTLDPLPSELVRPRLPPQGADIDETGALASGNTAIRGASAACSRGAPHPAPTKAAAIAMPPPTHVRGMVLLAPNHANCRVQWAVLGARAASGVGQFFQTAGEAAVS